jgi:hypothetical protein
VAAIASTRTRTSAAPASRDHSLIAIDGIRPRKLKFAPDSPLEEDGFELSVPVARSRFDLERFCGGYAQVSASAIQS